MAALMFQGTGSDVGKSVLVAGVCRALTNRELSVRPFKPQNMSNNAAVAVEGGEVGRAQALQAMACRVPVSVDMNPVLIKPQSDATAQLVVRGAVRGTMDARYYRAQKNPLLATVLESYQRLTAQADIVVVEGAGSPAETNLRVGDIANMGFARVANVPVILIGDIDRGGVIASLVGTHLVLDADDRAMIRGFLINKFRGDVALFADGISEIERRTGWPSLGIVRWLGAAGRLPAEDAVVLGHQSSIDGGLVIAVPMLSRIANFDDFDALRQEAGVRLVMVPPGEPLPADAAMVILSGTKATIADLKFFRAQGWDIDLAAHLRRGGRVLGICGGYQMLGETIADPEGIEGAPESVQGLGHLPVHTRLSASKQVGEVSGVMLATAAAFDGYEIHMGRTDAGPDTKRMLRFADGSFDGACSADGRVAGCYVHGLFNHPELRTSWLQSLGASCDGIHQHVRVNAVLDELAHELEQVMNMEQLLRIAGYTNN